MKTTKLILGLALVLMTFSCSKEDNSSPMTAEEATVNAKIDVMNDDVSKIVEDQLTEADGISDRSTETIEPFLPSCATVTRVPAYGTTPTVGQFITKTIDFGTEGCALPNGNILKGVITMTFTYEPDAIGHHITYTFINFYHNAIKFNGTKTFFRLLTTPVTPQDPHPVVTMNMDMTATLPNGNVVTRVGTRTRAIIEGYGTAPWLDNVYQIGGNWTTTFASGAVRTSTITTPLIIRMNCGNIVQGVIEIVTNSNTATLDYGNGECDNIAVVTINGVEHTITLGN